MDTKFQIEEKSEGTILYLNLSGQFDEPAVWELIKLLYRECHSFERINVDTTKAAGISENGLKILDNNLNKEHRKNIVFTGKNVSELIPSDLDFHTHEKFHICRGNCKNCSCRSLKIA